MNRDPLIFLYVGIGLGMVLACAHPQRGRVYAAIGGRLLQCRQWLPPTQPFVWRNFWLGMAVALLTFALANVIPYALTYDNPARHGNQTLGFPFTFWSYGGWSPIARFYPKILILDVVIALAGACAYGLILAKFRWQRAKR